MQSASARQPFWYAHVLPVVPPQSTSVSVPFFTLSVLVGTWQAAPVQTPLLQSSATRHALRSAHGGLPTPPQSTSVSVPSLTPSAGVGAVHVPALQ